MHSPKRKYRGVINFSKPLKGIGSQVTFMADDIEQLKSYGKMYKENEYTMYIYENKKTYPEFDWEMVEKYIPSYWGGKREGAGRKALYSDKKQVKVYLTDEALELLTAEQEDSGLSRSDVLNKLILENLKRS